MKSHSGMDLQWNSHDLADKHSPVEATMGDTHQRIAQGEYRSDVFGKRKMLAEMEGEAGRDMP
ncbi:hypothetical protein E2C01_017966 [Portunus trituberculatus]|uniref:Uncharacterized protein n=1 Tax=Portunus trituberculatus TaxID=210409 RepID=A0A5B7DTA6_PORTR|nr:hypothetical protein [Portunus trituberculatus]